MGIFLVGEPGYAGRHLDRDKKMEQPVNEIGWPAIDRAGEDGKPLNKVSY